MSSGDSSSEVSSQGWLSRIGNSIKGVLVGLLLFVISFPLLFWNEGRAVGRAKDLEEGSKNVVSVQADGVVEANNGKLVHLTGMAEPEGTLTDPDFGISAQAIHLQRKVEMYQWREQQKQEKKKKLGGGEETVTTYTYVEVWSDRPEELSYSSRDAKYANPPMPRIESKTWAAEIVKVGAFRLSKELIDRIEAFETLPVNSAPPEGSQGKSLGFVARDGVFYKSADPDKTKDRAIAFIGDIRVSCQEVKPQTVSIIARQNNGTFEAYTTKRGGKLLELRLGELSAETMIAKAAEENNALTWLLRLAGFLLMAVGIYLMVNPLVVLADVIPFLGGLMSAGVAIFAALIAFCLSLITIAIGWIFYRPLLGFSLLAVAGLGIGLVIFFIMKRKGAARLAKG
jgi:hypothetical protein